MPPVFLALASFQHSQFAEPRSQTRRPEVAVMFSMPTLGPHCSLLPKPPHMHHCAHVGCRPSEHEYPRPSWCTRVEYQLC